MPWPERPAERRREQRRLLKLFFQGLQLEDAASWGTARAALGTGRSSHPNRWASFESRVDHKLTAFGGHLLTYGWAAFERLRFDRRQVLRLHLCEGQTQEQVGELFGKSERWVRATLSAGLDDIAGWLWDHEGRDQVPWWLEQSA